MQKKEEEWSASLLPADQSAAVSTEPLPNMATVINTAMIEAGDRVRLLEGAAFHIGAVGVVTRADVPVARAYEVGWDCGLGLIEVQIDPNTFWQGHCSHVEKIDSVTQATPEHSDSTRRSAAR
jgi:hypothetical protein